MRKYWKRLFQVVAVLSLFFVPILSSGDEGHYPGTSWERLSAPDKLGWSREKLKAAREFAATISTEAVMVIVNGQVLEEWGETATRYNVHSIRKSFLSALFGNPVREGRINLSATMEELGIDDNEPSLTPIEKKATVGDLLKARSGIYHPALYETPVVKATRPPRGSHAPGTFWHYNNWDFNVLGTIFERQWWIAVNGKHLVSVDLPDGSYSARGSGGHYILIVPPLDLVIVHGVNTDIRSRQVTDRQFSVLVRLILEARDTEAPSRD